VEEDIKKKNQPAAYGSKSRTPMKRTLHGTSIQVLSYLAVVIATSRTVWRRKKQQALD